MTPDIVAIFHRIKNAHGNLNSGVPSVNY